MGDGPPADPLGRLLPHLLRLPGTAAPVPWPSAPEDGDALVASLERHGLAPLAHHRLHDADVPGLTSGQRDRLAAARHGAAASSLSHLQALKLLDDGFHERSVRVLVLKGRSLAQAAWPDPSLRPSCDVDLLVAPDDLAAAEDVFRSCGWEPSPEGRNKWRAAPKAPGLPPLDVSTSPRAEGARNPTWRPALEGLLSSATVMDGFRSLRALAPEHALVHGAVHAMDHAAARFVWLLDLAFLVERTADLTPRALDHAVEARARRATTLALGLTGRLVDLGALSGIAPPWGTDWFVRRVLRRPSTWGDGGMGRAGRLVLRLALVDRPSDLLR